MKANRAALPVLPDEQRLRSVNAYPKAIVAGMHYMLQAHGKNNMPLRVVLGAYDLEQLREHHLSLLPKKQQDYTDFHWACLRHSHSLEEQLVWLDKQVVNK